jgi:hypothetical protein
MKHDGGEPIYEDSDSLATSSNIKLLPILFFEINWMRDLIMSLRLAVGKRIRLWKVPEGLGRGLGRIFPEGNWAKRMRDSSRAR